MSTTRSRIGHDLTVSATNSGEPDSADTRRGWLPFRLPLLLAALGGSAWAAVGVWNGGFAGWTLLGEPNGFEHEVGGRQLYWAGAALAAAVGAALVTVFGAERPRIFVPAGALVITSIALSVPGWDARDAAIHPRFAPELQAFRPPSGTHLVQEKPGGFDSPGAKSAHRIWQSNREVAAVCAEVESEFRRFASNVTHSRDGRCWFDGDRGAFGTFVKVDVVTSFDNRAGIEPLDPRAGRIGIYFALIAS